MKYLPYILAISLTAIITVSISDTVSTEDKTQGLLMGGIFTAWVHDEYGNLVYVMQTPNLVVTEGENIIADLIFEDINFDGNATEQQFDVVGIGTGSTAPADGNTDLETSIAGCAKERDATVDGNAAVDGGSARASVEVSFSGATCAGSITEAVLMNDLSGGELLARQTFGAVAVGAGDTLTVEYNFTVSDDGV